MNFFLNVFAMLNANIIIFISSQYLKYRTSNKILFLYNIGLYNTFETPCIDFSNILVIFHGIDKLF